MTWTDKKRRVLFVVVYLYGFGAVKGNPGMDGLTHTRQGLAELNLRI